ncbi:hypothetical protein V5R04_00340 [Jonesiaceae bacterium BS-20]|uniref:Secreted protein n=1 Tax=Jonesiaceae bacterium BS-20 TaxID=3120821 RepID=A0AAU7DV53_9MICO
MKINKMRKGLFSLAALALVFSGISTPASAVVEEPSETLTIDGRTYGPEDGLITEIEQHEVGAGEAPVNVFYISGSSAGGITPYATWGSSYATSTETAQLKYTGKAKAGANVFDGKRIIQVCVWYTRGGAQVGSKVCSNATPPGTAWKAGPEKTVSVWDSLNPVASKTIFNISTSRIAPNLN